MTRLLPLLAILAPAMGTAGCGPPTLDGRALHGLPRVARAPAAEAERALLSAERDLLAAGQALREARDERRDAAAAVARAEAGHGDVNFARTRLAFLDRVAALREASVLVATRRVDLARARWELAKANVADAHSVPEAVGLDLDAFSAEVDRAAASVETAITAEAGIKRQVAILKKAVHAARVANLKAAGGP